MTLCLGSLSTEGLPYIGITMFRKDNVLYRRVLGNPSICSQDMLKEELDSVVDEYDTLHILIDGMALEEKRRY